MIEVSCKICGIEYDYDYSDILYNESNVFVYCANCGSVIYIVVNESIGYEPHDIDIPPLQVGTKVRLVNHQHQWHGMEATITAKKHKHYRILINDILLTVPENWVEVIDEHSNAN